MVMVWCMGNTVVCCDARCGMCGCGIPSDVKWFDAILDMV